MWGRTRTRIVPWSSVILQCDLMCHHSSIIILLTHFSAIARRVWSVLPHRSTLPDLEIESHLVLTLKWQLQHEANSCNRVWKPRKLFFYFICVSVWDIVANHQKKAPSQKLRCLAFSTNSKEFEVSISKREIHKVLKFKSTNNRIYRDVICKYIYWLTPLFLAISNI